MKLFGRKRRREEIQNQSRTVIHRQQAWRHFEAGDHHSAREEFTRLVELEPLSAAAWFGLGWCNLLAASNEDGADALKVFDACEPMFEKAVRLNEVSGELTPRQMSATHLQLGWARAFRKDVRAATAHFAAAVEAAPDSDTSAQARNELASHAMRDGDLVTAERLLREALDIDPQHEMAAYNLTQVLRRVDGFEIVFTAWFPLPGVQTAVWVHPNETLGEIAARVFSEHGLTYTGGTFVYSGDEALPHFIDGGYREPNATVRELGMKERDEVIYTQTVEAPGTSWGADFDLREIREHLDEGRPALARRKIAESLESVKEKLQFGELEEAEGKINALLKLDPGNVAARDLSARVQRAINERDGRSASADGESWTHSHGVPTRTGQTASGPMPPLQPAWEFVSKDSQLNPSVVNHGRVYVTSWDGYLYCLDGETGQEHWCWTAKTILQQPPVVGDKVVYAVDRTALHCLDALTGELRWMHESAELRSPALSNDKIYFADKEGVLSCLDANTGRLIKKVATGELNLTALLVNDDGRLFAASDQAILCADLAGGRLSWRREGRFDEAVPVLANGNVYIGTFAEGLWCIDANDGRIVWLFSTEARVRAAPAAGRGRIFFGDTGGRFGCLDASTGELLWTPREWLTNQIACSAAPVIAGPCLYVHLDDGILYCLDTITGIERWRGTTQEWESAVGSLAITAAAIYYVTRNGVLGCLSDADFCARVRTPRRVVTRPPRRTNLPPLRDEKSEPQGRLRDYGRPTSLSHEETNELHLAVFHLRANHLDEGIAILRRLERDHPDEGIVLHNLGNAYEWQGLIGDALSVFDHILDIYPDDAHAFAALGRLLRAHPDVIQAIYGSPSSFHQPPVTVPFLQQGLTAAAIAGEAAVLVKADGALAANFGESPAWYWWQLIETSHYPVLRFYLEFDYQPYRLYELLLPLDIAERSTKTWLDLLQAQEGVDIHIYDLADEYLISRRLGISDEQRARVRSLYERAQVALSATPAASRDFKSAVIEAQTTWEKATRSGDRAAGQE